MTWLFLGGGASVSAATCVEAVAVPPFSFVRYSECSEMDDRKHQKIVHIAGTMLAPTNASFTLCHAGRRRGREVTDPDP